jgi:hypothetical protein
MAPAFAWQVTAFTIHSEPMSLTSRWIPYVEHIQQGLLGGGRQGLHLLHGIGSADVGGHSAHAPQHRAGICLLLHDDDDGQMTGALLHGGQQIRLNGGWRLQRKCAYQQNE